MLSTGPGMVYRHYRIEISANNGSSMGTVDIKDEDDLKLVVGKEHAHMLAMEPDERNLTEIFRHIVQNRVILNIAPSNRKERLGGRREGIMKTGGQAGSVLSLQRDDPAVFSVIDESSTVGVPSAPPSISPNPFWVRLFSKRHFMSGRQFRTLVMLMGPDEDMFKYPDKYFSKGPLKNIFDDLEVVFKSQDQLSKETATLRLDAEDVYKWLPQDFPMDLGHKFRRARFGNYLIENLRMKYAVLGDYHLELFNMSKPQFSL